MVGRRTVIIGAGVVGAALADELSALGWTDIVVVDQGDLPATGGSTSHAPGLVFQASGSKVLTELATYTVEKFVDLTHEGKPCFLQVGGLEVATTPERLADLHRRHGWLTSWGVEAEVVDADRCIELHPLLDRDRVLGGLWCSTDGLAKALWAVEAQMERAKARGVRFLARHEVTDIRVEDGEVTAVVTDQGVFPADVIVSCAGIWGPKVAALVGLGLPLTPLAHQLGWTSALPVLAGQEQEAIRPILRHQESGLYYRDHFESIGIGYYHHEPMPISAHDIRAVDETKEMPSVLAFTPQDFEPAWEETQRLLPATQDAKVEEGINGLFSFTTDGMPLLGESREVKGFWVAEAVWVTHSAGVGRAVAEWIANGYCETFDIHECDVNRFEDYQVAPTYVLERDCQNFREVYDILHPLQPMDSPRNVRLSPFFRREEELDAIFLPANGWERPHWYGANAPLLERYDIPVPNDWAAKYWDPIAGAEAKATREGVAMYDMTALKRINVSGPGVVDFLQRLCTNDVDKSVGAVVYTLLLDVDGGIRSDITVARLGRYHYQVGANGALDIDWFERHLPEDGTVQVTDITPGTCCLGLWGPKARDVLASITDTDMTNDGLKYFRAKSLTIGNVPATAWRLSYVGELGWEIYTTADLGQRLWDTLWEAGQEHGIIAAGRSAFNSLRLEKGYRSFGGDMTNEHDPYEAGLGFAVKLDKGDFIGREALIARKEHQTRTLACLTIDNTEDVVLGKEPVFADGKPVGYVTSAAYGYTIEKGIAYAWLPLEAAEVGAELEIGYFDKRVRAVVTAEPLFDPKMTRLRG